MKTNLIDVWQHVGEAGGEDDSTAKHGEAREQGDHGGRLRKESSICASFPPAGFLSDAANRGGHPAVEELPPVVMQLS